MPNFDKVYDYAIPYRFKKLQDILEVLILPSRYLVEHEVVFKVHKIVS